MSSGGSELRGFVFAVVFIVIFGTLLSSIPAGLQGPDETPDTIIPIDPNIITGFAETENYTPAAFYPAAGAYWYEYPDTGDFGGRQWIAATDDATVLELAAKVLIIGIFWFGQIDICQFTAPSGQERGTQLAFDEIDADADDGTVIYSLLLTDSGDSAGSFVVYWNITAYPDFDDAWNNDEAYLLHGLGFDVAATSNIGAVIVSLLFLQLPDVPALVNIFIAVPIWACIIYVIWFIIKEMIPFV